MNGAIGEWGGECVVDEPVLLDEREPVEARARDGDLEVVPAAGAVLDRHLVVRERFAEQLLQALRHLRARYSSRSERVSIPLGLPLVATTTAWLPPVRAEKTSSSDSSASTADSGGCIAAATSSLRASGLRKTRSSRPRSWSDPTTSASEPPESCRVTGSCEIEYSRISSIAAPTFWCDSMVISSGAAPFCCLKASTSRTFGVGSSRSRKPSSTR